jgi:hypothetical protein
MEVSANVRRTEPTPRREQDGETYSAATRSRSTSTQPIAAPSTATHTSCSRIARATRSATPRVAHLSACSLVIAGTASFAQRLAAHPRAPTSRFDRDRERRSPGAAVCSAAQRPVSRGVSLTSSVRRCRRRQEAADRHHRSTARRISYAATPAAPAMRSAPARFRLRMARTGALFTYSSGCSIT